MLDQQVVTLVAALVAAFVSIFVAIITIINSQNIDQTVAGRTLLAKDLADLGNELYAVVALSKLMVNAQSDDSFASARLRADAAAKKLDELRRKNRYALWGIDDGFRTIQWCPVYIAHHKNDRHGERAKTIIEMSTALREAIDKIIMESYFSGKKPGVFRRWHIQRKSKSLREYFDAGAPEPAADEGI